MTTKTKKIDAVITDPSGEVIFKKKDFEIPEFYSDRAGIIIASKYATDEENSAVDIIDRVVEQIGQWGFEQGYFGKPTDKKWSPISHEEFKTQLTDILINQRASFNSPVWFNVGTNSGSEQASACFILPVEDTMESILQYSEKSGMIFKGGSGAGVNVSKLRAKGELLSNRGKTSGPISFMKIWDAVGGSVKSGGKNRRSAAMICMDVDHPDIMEFIECKKLEEDKAKILIAGGVDPEEAYQTVFFQNANHSIRVTDEFMNIIRLKREEWALVNRGDKKLKYTSASSILRRAAEIAWETGDPGIQFHDRMNIDNPVPSMGEIRSTNPCSEFSSIDNSACNLSSLNLIKYWDGTEFNWVQFRQDIYILITAMDILVDAADYPTPEIREVTTKTRPLGLGFTNLGTLLMLRGMPYDSKEARNLATSITKAMTTYAYEQSIELAKKLGSFESFRENQDTCVEICTRLTETNEFEDGIREYGLRNSQLTLLAPCGTISIMMDADSTGIEPLFALKSTKILAGGGTMEMIPHCIEKIRNIISRNKGLFPNNPDPADYCDEPEKWLRNMSREQKAIFKTANEIHWKDHILMVAACQKHLSSATSKTINLPTDATVEDIEEAYMFAWEQGLKSIAVYRDGSKMLQPLVAKKKQDLDTNSTTKTATNDLQWSAVRRKLPSTRESITHAFNIGGFEGYLTVGLYEDGDPGELFINMQKQGAPINGLMDSFAICVSFSLQYGVPLTKLVDKFRGTRFEPAGFTDNEDIRVCTSLMDYIFRWLAAEFLDEDDNNNNIPKMDSIVPQDPKPVDASGPICIECGHPTIMVGRCFQCFACGFNAGCS